MKNLLTLDERLCVGRLINHGLLSHVNDLKSQALMRDEGADEDLFLSQDTIGKKFSHIRDILGGIYAMSQYTENCYFKKEKNHDFRWILGRLGIIPGKENKTIHYNLKISDPLITRLPIVYISLHNLIKNSWRAGAEEVRVDVTEHQGDVPDPIYVPNMEEETDRFVKFTVSDNGPGFPQDRSLKEFLDFGVSTKEHRDSGLGLYFVTLACKFLRSYLTIDSVPGDTKVSIYHPRNLR